MVEYIKSKACVQFLLGEKEQQNMYMLGTIQPMGK